MKSVIIVLSLLLAQSAFAGKAEGGDAWISNLNITMITHKTGDTKSEFTAYDLTVGYSYPKGWYLGAIYGNGDGTTKYTHMGVSAGYILNGWDFKAHYLLGGEYNSSYEEGTGTQFDLGYIWKTSTSVYVGVQMVMRNMEYTPSAGGAKLKVEDMYPAIKLAFGW